MVNSDSKAKAALGKCLASMGLPPGLLSAVHQSYQTCDSRLWLIDDSSMMKVRDSHVGRGGKEPGSIERVDGATRWSELQECVSFHARMASRCRIPTRVCLANDSRKFDLCRGAPEDIPEEMARLKAAVTGASLDMPHCPLASCVRGLAAGLAGMGPDLRTRNDRVTLVICTQGLPTDRDGRSGPDVSLDFMQELSELAEFPVRIIIRLCTDEEKVRNMFTLVDRKFDHIDVLDDFWSEAYEVYFHNPWLTYSIGLHRLRESGFAPNVMNYLDERPLKLEEIHELCYTLFVGVDGSFGLPDPQKDWSRFSWALEMLVEKERPQWNPVHKTMMPWIDMQKLGAVHGEGRLPVRDQRTARRHSDNASRRSSQASQDPPEQDRLSSSQQSRHPRSRKQQPPRRASQTPVAASNARPRQHRRSSQVSEQLIRRGTSDGNRSPSEVHPPHPRRSSQMDRRSFQPSSKISQDLLKLSGSYRPTSRRSSQMYRPTSRRSSQTSQDLLELSKAYRPTSRRSSQISQETSQVLLELSKAYSLDPRRSSQTSGDPPEEEEESRSSAERSCNSIKIGFSESDSSQSSKDPSEVPTINQSQSRRPSRASQDPPEDSDKSLPSQRCPDSSEVSKVRSRRSTQVSQDPPEDSSVSRSSQLSQDLVQ